MPATLKQLIRVRSTFVEDTKAVLTALADAYDCEHLESRIAHGEHKRRIGDLAVDVSVSVLLEGIYGRRFDTSSSSDSFASEAGWGEKFRNAGAKITAVFSKFFGAEKTATPRNQSAIAGHLRHTESWSLASRPTGNRQPKLFVAPPGYGKTFLSQWAAVTWAREQIELLHAQEWEKVVIPIWLTAQEIAKAPGNTFLERVECAWLKSFPAEGRSDERQHNRVVEALRTTRADKQKVLIFVDSLDELGSDQLESFRMALRDVGMLGDFVCFTSRPNALLLNDRPAELRNARELEILPLDDLQQEDLVTKCLKGAKGEIFAGRLRNEFPQLRSCAEVPLLLRFMCENGVEDVSKPADVLRIMVGDVMKGGWGLRRPVNWPAVFGNENFTLNLVLAHARIIVREVSAQLFLAAPQSNAFEMDDWNKAWEIAEKSPAARKSMTGLDMRTFQQALVDAGMVMKGHGGDWYFPHRQLLEYLMAEWLGKQSDEEIRRLVLPRLGFVDTVQLGCHPDWEPTLDFLATLGKASLLIELMEEVAQSEGDDFFRSLLLHQVRWASLGGDAVPKAVRERLAKEVVRAGFGRGMTKLSHAFFDITRPRFWSLTREFFRQIARDEIMREFAIAALRERWLRQNFREGCSFGLALIAVECRAASQDAGEAMHQCMAIISGMPVGAKDDEMVQCLCLWTGWPWKRGFHLLLPAINWARIEFIQRGCFRLRENLLDLALTRSTRLEEWIFFLELAGQENAHNKAALQCWAAFLRIAAGQTDSTEASWNQINAYHEQQGFRPGTLLKSIRQLGVGGDFLRVIGDTCDPRKGDQMGPQEVGMLMSFLLASPGSHGKQRILQWLNSGIISLERTPLIWQGLHVRLCEEGHPLCKSFVEDAFQRGWDQSNWRTFGLNGIESIMQSAVLGATHLRLGNYQREVMSCWHRAEGDPHHTRLRVLEYFREFPDKSEWSFFKSVSEDSEWPVDHRHHEGKILSLTAVEVMLRIDPRRTLPQATMLIRRWLEDERTWACGVNIPELQPDFWKHEFHPVLGLLACLARYEETKNAALDQMSMLATWASQKLSSPEYRRGAENRPPYKSTLSQFIIHLELLRDVVRQQFDEGCMTRPKSGIRKRLACEYGGRNAFAAQLKRCGDESAFSEDREALWNMSQRLHLKASPPLPAENTSKANVSEIILSLPLGLAFAAILLCWIQALRLEHLNLHNGEPWQALDRVTVEFFQHPVEGLGKAWRAWIGLIFFHDSLSDAWGDFLDFFTLHWVRIWNRLVSLCSDLISMCRHWISWFILVGPFFAWAATLGYLESGILGGRDKDESASDSAAFGKVFLTITVFWLVAVLSVRFVSWNFLQSRTVWTLLGGAAIAQACKHLRMLMLSCMPPMRRSAWEAVSYRVAAVLTCLAIAWTFSVYIPADNPLTRWWAGEEILPAGSSGILNTDYLLASLLLGGFFAVLDCSSMNPTRSGSQASYSLSSAKRQASVPPSFSSPSITGFLVFSATAALPWTLLWLSLLRILIRRAEAQGGMNGWHGSGILAVIVFWAVVAIPVGGLFWLVLQALRCIGYFFEQTVGLRRAPS